MGRCKVPCTKQCTNNYDTEIKVGQALQMGRYKAALQAAIAGLTEVDLTAPIVIQDVYLRDSIKTTLGITGDLTLGDMLKLTTLNSKSGGVRSLEGLQYANNLVTLDITGNAITDFSPLKGLTKLDNLLANPQIVEIPLKPLI
jgi:Leucine-rich repeat (LRR) protein